MIVDIKGEGATVKEGSIRERCMSPEGKVQRTGAKDANEFLTEGMGLEKE